jgi:hypothetical protein
MKILHEYPPNIDLIESYFPKATKGGVLFAYDGNIYAPGLPNIIEMALIQHERCHILQQEQYNEGDADGWWLTYCVNEKFRLEQEYEAHLSEYLTRLGFAKNRADRRAILPFVAKKLASPLYGNMIKTRDAQTVLERGYLNEPVRGDTQGV